MGKYCVNCGAELHAGARFCARCGAAVITAPANPVPPAPPNSAPGPQAVPAVQKNPVPMAPPNPVSSAQQIHIPAAPPNPAPLAQQIPATPPDYVPAPQPAPTPAVQQIPVPAAVPNYAPQPQYHARPIAAPKKKRGQSVLCIVLSILLAVQIAAVALFGWPGFLVRGGTKTPSVKKTDSLALQEGQIAVTTKSGVSVEFGPYNAMDGEKVTIKEMTAVSADVEGSTRTAYDITAGKRSGFEGLLEITLPYDESATDPSDEEGSVFAEYYNPETGEWELVDYTVNTADNTVTIITDHLSQYCTVTVQDAGSPYALLSKFTNRRLDDETALTILREYEATGKPGEVGSKLLNDFYKQLISVGGPLYIDDYDDGKWLHILARQAQNWGADESQLLYDVQSWMVDVAELAAQGGGYKQLAGLLEKGGYLLLGVSSLSLGDAMIKAYKGDESAEAVAAEAYKLSYNVGLAWLDYKKVTTGMVQLSMLGVIAIDYSLNSFMTAADQTYKDALYNVVIAYNEEVHPWTEAEWYARIMGLYRTRGDDPERFNAALRGVMENYSARYFYDNPEEQLVATNAAGLHTYTTGILPETEAAKQYCIEQYVARLGEYLQPVLDDVVKHIQHENRKAYCANANELRKALNAPLIFEIEEEIPDGEQSKYAGCVVDICRPDALVDKNWTAVLDKNGRAVIEATVLGYIQACIPTQIRVWHKGDEEFEKDPVFVRDFAATKRVTYIPLGQPKNEYDFYLVERYNFDNRYLYYDGYGYQIMAVKRDMENNRVTEHLIKGIEAEVEQDIYRDYKYDSSTGLLTITEDQYYTELKPNEDWTAFRGYRKYPEYITGGYGSEGRYTGEFGYEYFRFLAVTPLSSGAWQVKETGETIQFVYQSYDASDNQTKRLESPSGQGFLAEARAFAADIGREMYDGQGYD